MTREKFITKWLGAGYTYTEESKDLMRHDLDLVIKYAHKKTNFPPAKSIVCSHPQFVILGCPFDDRDCEECRYYNG